MLFASAVSRCDVDKRDFIHFVYSVRWHCTNSMKTMGLNEDIDRTVLGECNMVSLFFLTTKFLNFNIQDNDN